MNKIAIFRNEKKNDRDYNTFRVNSYKTQKKKFMKKNTFFFRKINQKSKQKSNTKVKETDN